jgi:hypothetical protein
MSTSTVKDLFTIQEVKQEPTAPKKEKVKGKKKPTAAVEEPTTATDAEEKRAELIRAIEDDEFKCSLPKVKKASAKVIGDLYLDLQKLRSDRANMVLTDLLISKVSDLLGGFEAIESSEELEKELSKDEMLRRDVCSLIQYISPYIPYLGLVTGGGTVFKHIYKKQTSAGEERKE